jgi:hypothetical protein
VVAKTIFEPDFVMVAVAGRKKTGPVGRFKVA